MLLDSILHSLHFDTCILSCISLHDLLCKIVESMVDHYVCIVVLLVTSLDQNLSSMVSVSSINHLRNIHIVCGYFDLYSSF